MRLTFTIALLIGLALPVRGLAQTPALDSTPYSPPPTSVSPRPFQTPIPAQTPAPTTNQWGSGTWIAAMAWGDLGGLVLGAGGALVGIALGSSSCHSDSSSENWGCLGSTLGGMVLGAGIGWTLGVPAGVTLYGHSTARPDGSYWAALGGGLVGTLASLGAIVVLKSEGASMLLVTVPTFGSTLGYYLSTNSSGPPSAPALSLIQYQEGQGFRLGSPSIAVSSRGGERTVTMRLLGGTF